MRTCMHQVLHGFHVAASETNTFADCLIKRRGPSFLAASRRGIQTNPERERMMRKKHLSATANEVVQRCARQLDTSVDKLVEEFEAGWKPETSDYSRKLVEFCSSKSLHEMCPKIAEMISDGSFSGFSFDMMLAWERPSSADEESHTECMAKEKEEPKRVPQDEDDIPLFYSDIMPLLVDEEKNIGEDAFVWMGSLVPLVADVVSGRFTFETLTAPTGYRLHFPGYDLFLREIDKCIKHLQKQARPTGVELADNEYILHVEGTAGSQRVIRHIGGTSWPGRLTLTNYALYFETSGVISYEDAIKIDLSKDIEHSVKSSATGPWGAPLFDKAIIYESPELPEPLVLEFPELTSSTRRDHWLALIKEVILLHRFLSKFMLESPIQAWEMHARTILAIIRLHAAREMLRISPPVPTKFLIFALFDEVPKGDYVLEELAGSLKNFSSGHPCSASSILRNLNFSQSIVSNIEVKKGVGGEIKSASGPADNLSSLENTINQVREETKEIEIAKAPAEKLKEEGISETVFVIMELLSPLKSLIPWFQEVVWWKRPASTLTVIAITELITYKEWIGKAIAVFLLWLVAKMLKARRERIKDKCPAIVVSTASDQTTMESIVSAQHGLQTVHDLVQKANIAILKIRSIFVSRATKHANTVMMVMSGIAILLMVVPIKFIIMGSVLHYFIMSSSLAKYFNPDQGSRRLNEWWDSIPVIPVKFVDNVADKST